MATTEGADVAALARVLAHPLRWAVVRKLTESDLRVGELARATDQRSNLISYHLRELHQAGLVTIRRSAADGRDSYYALDLDAVADGIEKMALALHPGLGRAPARPDRAAHGRPSRVLFICTSNASRSQMAEGWLRHLGGSEVVARSAGTAPKGLNPLAVAAMAERGVDIRHQESKGVGALAADRFDWVVTLCDLAREVCPEPAPGARTAHWSIPNPADAHPAGLDAYRSTAGELEVRIRYFLGLILGRAAGLPPAGPSATPPPGRRSGSRGGSAR